MDEEVVRKITKPDATTGRCNGISVTPFGDVLAISSQVQFGNIRQKSTPEENGLVHSLKAFLQTDASKKPVNFSEFDEIVANEDGSILLLKSSDKVGIIELSPEFYLNGYLDNRISQNGTSATRECVVRIAVDVTAKNHIVKAVFHPTNKYALLLLLQTEEFLVYDIRIDETTRYRLPRNMQFVSFCCGPDVDWLRFSVFISNNRGELYALCPIIPAGTMISLTILEELWNWVDNQREFWIGSDQDPTDKLRLDYVNILEAYLCDLFGDVETILKDAADLDSKDDEYVVAGEGKFVTSDIMLNRSICIANYNVVVQGPLHIEQGKAKDARGVVLNNSHTICDLCAPRVANTSVTTANTSLSTNAETAPVIAVVRATGLVEILLFDGTDDRVGYIAPRFESLGGRMDEIFVVAAPVLLQADTFSAPGGLTPTNDSWQLFADPVYAHYFYLLNKSAGSAFILSSGWLKSMLDDVAQSIVDAELALQQQESTWRGDDMFLESKMMSSPVYPGFSSPTSQTNNSTANNNKRKPVTVPEISLCLPLFEPPLASSSSSSDAASTAVALQSFAVYYDAYLGHIALLLLSSGSFIIVNVSVHTKLCELHTHLHQLSTRANQERDKGLSLLTDSLRKELTEYHVPYRTAQSLMTKIEEGLRLIPSLEVTVEREEDKRQGVEPSPAEARKLLATISAHLEPNVLVPLKRLHDNTLFHCEVVRDMVRIQHELIHGNNNNAAASTPNKTAFPGIKPLLQDMREKQAQLQARIARIQAKDEELRGQVAELTEFTTYLPRPLARAERVYHRQLSQWLTQVKAMNEEVALLKMKTDKHEFLRQQQQQQQRQSSNSSATATSMLSSASKPVVRTTTNNNSTSSFFKASSTSLFAASASASAAKLMNPTHTAGSNSTADVSTPWSNTRHFASPEAAATHHQNNHLHINNNSMQQTPGFSTEDQPGSIAALTAATANMSMDPLLSTTSTPAKQRTQPASSSSATSSSLFLSPTPMMQAAIHTAEPHSSSKQTGSSNSSSNNNNQLLYYHPEEVRFPAFASPNTATSVMKLQSTNKSILTASNLPNLSEEEAKLAQESLQTIGERLAEARKQVEDTWKDLKRQRRYLASNNQANGNNSNKNSSDLMTMNK